MKLFTIDIDLLPMNVAVYKKEGDAFIFVAFNTQAEKTDRIKREKLLGQDLSKMFPEAEKFGLIDILNRVYESGESEVLANTFYKDTRISGWRKNHVIKLENDLVAALYQDTSMEKELEIHGIQLEQELKEIKKSLYYQKALDTAHSLSMHDPLTNLPNRRYFKEHISDTFEQAKKEKREVAYLYIDLDGFKAINDKHSHKVGDQVLTKVTENFTKSMRKNEFIARLGGDEFCMVISDFQDKKALESIAKRLIEENSQTFRIDALEIHIGMSIGIAIYPKNGKTPEDLLASADLAMYAAKKDGGNKYVFAV